MGGIGSGQSGWRTRCEDMLALDFRKLKKAGHLMPGKLTRGWLKSPYRVAEINLEAQDRDLLLTIRCKPPMPPKWPPWQQRIPLSKMGRNRLCALCPKCGKAVQILYSGGMHFWCRGCHELAYASQFVGPEERRQKRAQSEF